jgi:hypothetical protein
MEIQQKLNPSLDKYTISRHFKPQSFGHTCQREFMFLTCSECGHKHAVLTGSRDRTCPACCREIYHDVYFKYEKLVTSKKDLKFLTLTWMPVEKQDPKIVSDIGKAFVRLLHQKKYRKAWKSILATIECKKTKSGLFYYHLHAIVEGKYIPQKQISKDWAKLTRFPIVHIKRIWRTPVKAFRYILKYVLKGFAFENEEDVLDFKSSMKGVRYLRTYGDFYNHQYKTGKHVFFPCPLCGAVKCWILPWNLEEMEYNGWEPGG